MRLRGFLLIFSTVLLLKAFRGYKKVPITLTYLYLSTKIFTPELVNPFHHDHFFNVGRGVKRHFEKETYIDF